ncbi:MFS transporter [Leptospirillum ferriphilum]|uniref:MFS transporter n=1 Tax=Leptospirillum ferriphilum TaxID=178606 RepID=UPI000A759F02|nr:MFS transporter [Leptospirillum ferriphilum]
MGGRLRRRDIAVVRPDVARKAAFGAAVGNAMEWFDFGIYSYLAVTIGKIFFPQVDPDAQLVASFATFAVAFLARPAGALFFGRLGDAIGRKSVLVITLAIMAISTFSIGLLPGYQTIGLTAAFFLFLARLAQGFSTGGEYAGAMTYVVEYSPDKRRGRMASLLEVGTLTGFILGAGMVTALTAWLGPEKMLQYGWRLPFFIAAPIGLFSAWFRSRLEETPAFESLEKNPEERPSKVSLKDLVRVHWRPMSIGLGLVLFYNVIDYMVLSYMPSYLSSVLGYGETKGLLLILVVMLIMIPVVFLVGAASDRWGRNPILRGALVSLLVWTIPAFLFVQNGQNTIVFAGLVLLGAHLAAFEGTMTSTLPSLFFYGGPLRGVGDHLQFFHVRFRGNHASRVVSSGPAIPRSSHSCLFSDGCGNDRARCQCVRQGNREPFPARFNSGCGRYGRDWRCSGPSIGRDLVGRGTGSALSKRDGRERRCGTGSFPGKMKTCGLRELSFREGRILVPAGRECCSGKPGKL